MTAENNDYLEALTGEEIEYLDSQGQWNQDHNFVMRSTVELSPEFPEKLFNIIKRLGGEVVRLRSRRDELKVALLAKNGISSMLRDNDDPGFYGKACARQKKLIKELEASLAGPRNNVQTALNQIEELEAENAELKAKLNEGG